MNFDAIRKTYAENWDSIYDWAGVQVRQQVTDDHSHRSMILDVGAGQGKYRTLLLDFPHVDGIEIWEPYVDEHRLRELYEHFYVGDATDVISNLVNEDYFYNLVIMGDVLEHMTILRAQYTVDLLRHLTRDIIVIVPFEYPQGEEHGNPYQSHEQADLTVEVMAERYPTLRLVTMQLDAAGRPFKGLYRWR